MNFSPNQNMSRELEFQWMKITGPNCNCSHIVHPGLTCLQQLALKFKTVLKTLSKFYLLFHIIPYLIKLQKAIRQKRFLSTTFKAILHFIGSILFMAHLVCGLKGTLCFYSNLNLQIGASTAFWGGIPTGISIFWESNTRREEITYYAVVRALRAAYQYLKRHKILPYSISTQFFLILFCGVLSYCYLEKTNNLKYANIFEGLWGKI